MRPIQLEIEGLRSFRERQTIDFTGRDHIAIIGDTGAGKSSILEALTFALYGRVTFAGRGNQELMNATAPVMRVVLRFEVGGERWEVARVAKRTGAGDVGATQAVLHRLDDAGERVEAYEKVREVNERVEAILGLDADAFLRTVVLPQGQFSRLLVDDEAPVRGAVLAQIWRTDELTAAGDRASRAVAELGPLVGMVEQARAGEPDDPEAHLAGLRSAAADAAAAAARATAGLERARAAATARREAEELADRVTKIRLKVGSWDGDEAVGAAAAVVEVAAALEADRHEATAAFERAQGVFAAVPGDGDGLDVAAVARALAVLDGIPALVDEHEAARAAADAARAAAVDAVAARDAAAAEAARTAADRAAAVEASRPLDEAVDAALAARTAAEAAAREAARCRAAADEAAKAATADQAAVGPAVEAADRAANDLVAAETARLAAGRAAGAAEVAHGLHAGEPCPVCDRPLEPGWKPPKAPQLARADKALAQAQKEHRKAADALAAARTTAEASAAAARAAASEAARTVVDPEAVERAGAEVAAAREAAAASKRAVEAATAADTAAQGAARAAEVAAEAADAAVQRARERAERAEQAVAAAWASLPAPMAGVGDVEAARAALTERRAVLDERAAARADARTAMDAAAAQRDAVDRGWRAEVDGAVAPLWAAAASHRDLVVLALQRLDLDARGLPAAVAPPIAELPAAIQALDRATVAVLDAAHAAGEAAAADAEAAAKKLAAVAGDLEVDPSGDVVGAAAKAATGAEVAARRAADDLAAFEPRVAAIAALADAGARLDALHRALTDLAAALKPGAFPKWLTQRRSRRLLVHASRLLKSMSGERYEFADLDDDAAPWMVIDNDNGRVRSPASLSGGEKFVASLALALGMVEMLGRAGGRLESLFLDEGFGALDRANLDAAIEALATVAASGRMVAVISHIRAVAEQVEHVLAVTREPKGSSVRWLDAAARRAVAGADLGLDPSIAGLLE